jgi:hypothetical protein
MNSSDENNDIMFIYEWVDSVPLSRAKKNITRDFADGVLMAELIKYCAPKRVEIHNYPTAHSTAQKLYNWNTLNRNINFIIIISKGF